MQDKMEESRLIKLAQDERERLSAHESELREYRALLSRQEKEFDSYRSRLKEEQLQRERLLQKENEERERLFVEREKQLLQRQRDFEIQLDRRRSEIESLRKHLQVEIAQRETQLQQAIAELEQEKERYKEEGRKRIEANSRSYVSDALDVLDQKERQFHRMSKIWASVGAAGLVSGVVFFIYIGISSAASLSQEITWPLFVFLTFKGLVAVALVAGLAKYSFLFSSYYMQEALKNADRRHAINFGKFYLESYGAAAEWSQVKEAFEHWNITAANAFSKSDPSLPDISALEKSVALIERVGKALPKNMTGSGA